MMIKNKNIEIKEYHNHFKKLKGLMFKKNINYGLKMRCNGIHTFFMKEDIDVVATNKSGMILHIWYNVKPWRVILPKKNVYFTYEFPTNIIDFKIGDIIK